MRDKYDWTEMDDMRWAARLMRGVRHAVLEFHQIMAGKPTSRHRISFFEDMLASGHESYTYVQPRMIAYREALEDMAAGGSCDAARALHEVRGMGR